MGNALIYPPLQRSLFRRQHQPLRAELALSEGDVL